MHGRVSAWSGPIREHLQGGQIQLLFVGWCGVAAYPGDRRLAKRLLLVPAFSAIFPEWPYRSHVQRIANGVIEQLTENRKRSI
jgi:hypothetical protein